MQRVDSGKKTFIALMDADGCFYNQIVDVSLRYLIAEHSQVIDKIVADPSIIKGDSNLINLMLNSIFENMTNFSGQLASTGRIRMRADINAIMIQNCEHDTSHSDEARKINEIKSEYIYKLAEVAELKEVYHTILLAANESLLSHIEARVRAESHHQLLLMSGSNRQSMNRELVNMINNGTAPFVMDLIEIVHLLRESVNDKNPAPVTCYFDQFLLADVYAGQRDGHSFDLMLQDVKSTTDEFFDHHDYVFDDTKFTLLYAMLHYAATKHQGHAITMAFFDDRMDIHDTISKIFRAHPDLIPENVTLECWHYHGAKLEQPVAVINGAGVIDHHFRENIKRIIEICGFSATEYERAVNTGAVILSDETMPLLAAFKEVRALRHPEQHELSSLFQNALTLFSYPEPRATSSASAAAAVEEMTEVDLGSTHSSLSSASGV